MIRNGQTYNEEKPPIIQKIHHKKFHEPHVFIFPNRNPH